VKGIETGGTYLFAWWKGSDNCWRLYFRIEKITKKTQETIGIKGQEAEGKAKEMAGEAKGKASELEGQAKGKAEELRQQMKP
jgi:uncharacterized protein YjbJ (UPF0337 family)